MLRCSLTIAIGLEAAFSAICQSHETRRVEAAHSHPSTWRSNTLAQRSHELLARGSRYMHCAPDELNGSD